MATIIGSTGNDIISPDSTSLPGQPLPGDGPDSIFGTAGEDNILGGGGADTLEGGAGNDGLSGEAGNDRLILDGADPADIDSLNGGQAGTRST
ncbi:MAG TPA: hypothetical protein VGN83_12525 [Falsiroseomonas sp.]|jgi:Ca2+-binding RTX toxin-like protein|nr:hypothetical protein [Falsiroseomonas sp.]